MVDTRMAGQKRVLRHRISSHTFTSIFWSVLLIQNRKANYLIIQVNCNLCQRYQTCISDLKDGIWYLNLNARCVLWCKIVFPQWTIELYQTLAFNKKSHVVQQVRARLTFPSYTLNPCKFWSYIYLMSNPPLPVSNMQQKSKTAPGEDADDFVEGGFKAWCTVIGG